MSGRLERFDFRGKSIIQDVFVETGTYLGETTENALRAGFKFVHTIEVCERLVKLAREKFSNRNNVTVHHGSSPDVLPSVLDPNLSTTIYLDGHYQGGPIDENDPLIGECPLLLELAVIRAISWKQLPIIIIDDSHIFTMNDRDSFLMNHNLNPIFWPHIHEIVDAIGPSYTIIEDDDRLYCFPLKGNQHGQELEEVSEVAMDRDKEIL